MLPPFLQRVEALGHKVFATGAYNLNLIGVRTSGTKPGRFDGWITCWYRDSDGEWQAHWWAATTEPGLHYLRDPLNVAGAAIMAPGQYPGLWKIGTHKGYKAFEQVGSVRVYRDNDRDSQFDLDPATIQAGDFSINGHAADSDPWDKYDKSREGDSIGRWSAGCQVWASSAGFRRAIQLAEQSRDMGVYGSRFTYTLVTTDEMGLTP